VADVRHTVATVIPVLDEVAAIADLVAGLRAAGSCCVYVVDGGSEDGTQLVTRGAGAIVVDEARRGYGRACLTGAAAARSGHPIVAFLDGDGSCDPDDLPVLVRALGTADVALGRRVGERIERGALPWHAGLGNAIVAAILRRRTGRPVHDLSPFKALRATALDTLALDDGGFGWTVQLVARSLRTPSLRIAEPPIAFRRRRGGTSKVTGSWRASAAAARRMLRNAVHETRARPVVTVVAKAPTAGHAKTRLAAEIGTEAALGFWRAALEDLGRSVRDLARTEGHTTLAVVPFTDEPTAVAALLGPGWEVVRQSRPGLGGAITDAVLGAAARGAPMVVVISGDNPTLPATRLRAAFDALRTAPTVLGPCPDGGYYLIGVRLGTGVAPLGDRLDRVFAAASLGVRGAFASTRDALTLEGLAPAILEPWADVAVAADLAALAATLRSPIGGAAPATAAWLERHAPLVAGSTTTGSAPVTA
jgi:glycosyltransferase A (GT-A) superfamily protein (DUF2064 family)